MMEWVDSIEFWHWMTVAIIALGGEILISGFFLLFVGIGALITGLAMLVFPDMDWTIQFALFGTVIMGSLVAWWKFGHNVESDDHPNLNKRGAQHVGRVYVLDEAMVNGAGWCRVGDSRWNLRGPDLAAGSRVKVIGVESNVLIVEAADT